MLSQLRYLMVSAVIFIVFSACSLTSNLTSNLPASVTPTESVEPAKSQAADVTEAEPDPEVTKVRAVAVPVVPTLPPAPTPLAPSILAEADAEEQLLINIYERVNPSVVNIEVTVERSGPSSLPNNLFPNQGQGSGFVVDSQGHIVTNNHVVADAERVNVTFSDGSTVPAELIGTDPDSDIAVLKVNVPAESLRPIQWGDSDEIRVGQRAVAIGNPFGLKGTLTSGIISARGRSLPTESGTFRIPEIIQTDAAINPGNSGGPLLNSNGEVIGINTAIVPRQSQFGERSFLGVGFAVPANLVQRVVPSLVENGKFEHPWIGFQGTTVNPEIAEAMGLERAAGALVVEIISGSPADEAGLRGGTREIVFDSGLDTIIDGDVIVAINEEPVTSMDGLISFLSQRGVVGDVLTLTIIRNSEEQQVEVTLGPRPTENGSD